MTVKRTPNQIELARRDDALLLDAVLDRLKADNPAWFASLPQNVKDAIARRNAKRGP